MSSTAAPRVSTRQMFTLLACAGCRPDEVPDTYLSYVATRRHRLSAYRRAAIQSLRLIPAIFGGDIEAVADLDGDAVSTWLASARRRTGRIVYLPLVNNVDGSVVSRARACLIFIRFGKQGSTVGGLLGWGYRVTEARADGGLE